MPKITKCKLKASLNDALIKIVHVEINDSSYRGFWGQDGVTIKGRSSA